MTSPAYDTLGTYWPGESVVHRCRAGVKLGVLAAASVALAVSHRFIVLAAAAAIVAVAYALARIPARVAWSQLRPLRWLAPALFAAQWWLAGWRGGLQVTGSLIVLLAAAALTSLTTSVGEILDTVARALEPLRRIGIEPDRVALLIALTIRTIPVILRIGQEASQARRARGAERSPRALLVPLVIRTVRHADHLGEALAARGVDD